jgi:hypothetical protein
VEEDVRRVRGLALVVFIGLLGAVAFIFALLVARFLLGG